VPPDALIVGVDLARERQAVSFVAGGEVLGRRRLTCGPQELDQVLGDADILVAEHGCSRLVVAFDPAGHYWCLAAEAFERRTHRMSWSSLSGSDASPLQSVPDSATSEGAALLSARHQGKASPHRIANHRVHVLAASPRPRLNDLTTSLLHPIKTLGEVPDR
jgi:hypothetical protein